MARIRSIKPEIRTSEKVNSWPIEVRFFWVMLWGYVDDHGRGRDNARLIVADSYPLDDSVSAETVEGWLAILAGDGVIVRYEVDGKRYLAVVNWDEHQKPAHPAKSVIPEPPEDYGSPREDYGSPHEALAKVAEKGSPEQLSSRAVEQGAESSRAGSSTAQKRGTRIPDPFIVTGEMRRWAAEKCPDVSVDNATAIFVDHWRAKAGRDATKLDWAGTWRNWLRRDQESAERRTRHGPGLSRDDRNLSVVAKFAAEELLEVEA